MTKDGPSSKKQMKKKKREKYLHSECPVECRYIQIHEPIINAWSES